jgi:hypothetical protein
MRALFDTPLTQALGCAARVAVLDAARDSLRQAQCKYKAVG